MSAEHYQSTYIQEQFAARIGGSNYGKDTNIYKFEKIKRAKAAAKKAHPDVELIDMGVGEPDEMADAGIVANVIEIAAISGRARRRPMFEPIAMPILISPRRRACRR